MGTWIVGWGREIGVSGAVDILIMTGVLYGVFAWLRRTQRASAVMAGILIVGAVYLIARQFQLHLTAGVLQGFFTIFLIAVVVIFQEELRHLFERVARWSLERRHVLKLRRSAAAPPRHADILSRALLEMARSRVGALVVLRGRDLVARHLEGGETLDGEISEALIRSIFDPGSPGHDGAVIIEGGRISRFGVHLPLSKNLDKVGRGGTRHTAALGLSELCDALCLVVSEERGTISAARHGNLQVLADPAALLETIESFHRELEPVTRTEGLRHRLIFNYKLKLAALATAVVLWFVLVYGSRTVHRTLTVPVELAGAAVGAEGLRTEPGQVRVTLSGPRRSFLFLGGDAVSVHVRAAALPGAAVLITAEDVRLPEDFVFEDVTPRTVVVRPREAPAP